MLVASGPISNADVDALESLVEITVMGAERLFVQFTVATASLSDFLVEAKASDGMGYSTMATATGDFTTPVFPILKASGDLNAAASGSTVHWMMMDCAGLHTVKLSAAGTSSVIAGQWRTV